MSKFFKSLEEEDRERRGGLITIGRVGGQARQGGSTWQSLARGKNTIEAYADAEIRGDSFWRFDFSATDRFVPGSLVVGTGAVRSLDGRSIAFRLTGVAGERIRFTFELAP